MKIKVKVTADDIKRGVRNSCSLCPIARALKRVRPAGYKRAAVIAGGGWLLFRTETKTLMADTPKTARYFISRFDNVKKVKPISFTLNFQ
jgi:hypothetical protein